jgi:hypothetical protein
MAQTISVLGIHLAKLVFHELRCTRVTSTSVSGRQPFMALLPLRDFQTFGTSVPRLPQDVPEGFAAT